MDYISIIRKLRKERGYSQAEVADYLQTTQQHYSCYENGKNELPIRHLISLCRLYHVTSDYILGISDSQDSTTITITAEAMSHELKHYIGKKQADDTKGYYKVD